MSDPGRQRGRRRWLWALGILAVLLALGLYEVPKRLLAAADARALAVSDIGSACRDPSAAAERALGLYRLAGHFPGFGERARGGPKFVAMNLYLGLDSCRLSDAAVPGHFFDPGLGVMTRIVRRRVRRPGDGYGPRSELESLLHHLGRDRAVLALAHRLPQGGNVLWRVTAALYLGRPKRAAAFWREPGAILVGYTPGSLLSRPAILCLVGDTDGGLGALDPSRWQHRNVVQPETLVDVHAACLRRAGRARALAHLATTARDEPWSWHLDRRIDAALLEGNLAEARRLSAERMQRHAPPSAQLRDLWLQVKTGHLAGLAHHPFAAWLRGPIADDTSLYYDGALPTLDEHALREVARGLAGAKDPALRRLAGRAWLVEAAYRGRRWDPRFQATLAKARALDRGDPAIDALAAAMAFFHGDFKAFDAAPATPALETLKHARAELTGDAPLPAKEAGEGNGTWTELTLTSLDPENRNLDEVAHLYRSGLSPATQLALLAREPQQATFADQLYRLTTLVRQGRLLHQDVSRWRERIDALRKMHDAQPAPDLLQVPVGRPGYTTQRY